MSMIKEFKEFASKGSVIDLAVGVIIGAAFGKIVTSFVDDILMPPIGLLLGGVDFSKLTLTLKEAVGDKPAVMIRYGIFINTLITFLIIAFCVFLLVKGVNSMKKKQAPAVIAPTKEEMLLTEIRDELRKR